jgi:KDO2-lipid IV(A) lauroyltransferase
MQRRLSATPEEVERWLERCFELIFSEKVEAHLYRRASVADITRMIEVRGLHNLDRALERGKGAILYSGHVAGHFTFFAALGLLGYPLNIVGFPEGMEQWVASRRNAFMEDRLGHRRLQMQRANFGIAVKAVNSLRRNGILTIEIDHPHAGPKVEVEFLGLPGYFPRGPAEIANASGAPLLSFWIHRPDEWRPQVAEIGPPYYVTEGNIDSALVHCASVLEHSIRKDPPSWLPWLFPRRRVWER